MKLLYSAITSLDGYVADEDGRFDWAKPDDELHAFVNDLERSVGTYLYGRRMYDVMVYWETAPTGAGAHPIAADYARVWQAADKVVFSSTLAQVPTRRTRLERQLDAHLVSEIKAASRGDLTVGGPTLAAEALRLDLVDVVELLWCPILLGGGVPVLSAGVRRDLRLRSERRFSNGVIHATYDVIGHEQS